MTTARGAWQTAARTAPVAAALLAALLVIAGCGYYKRTTTSGSTTSTSGAAPTSTEDAAVDLSGVWTLKSSGCDIGDDAWSRHVEVEHDVDTIEMRFTQYQVEIKLVGLVTGQKIRAERAVEENDGTLTWITFEGSYHSNGSVMAGEFTNRDGVTCELLLVR
jgi:hypothetical protein